MRRLLLTAALLTLAFAPAPLPKPAGRHDARALEGKWERVRLYNGGALIPERPGEVSLVVTGRTAVFWRNGVEQTRWAIKLDPRASPRRLDLEGLGASQGVVLHGIYRPDGETLTWCYSGSARPSSFDRPAPGVFLVVLKRKKP
jgi:uncharacterized protein (TIGR03067 family)